MNKDLTAVPVALDVLAATAHSAGQAINTAGTYDATAMHASVMGAIGPIGASFIAAFAQAQVNNQAAMLMLGDVHSAISGATTASKSGYQKVDSTL